MDPKRWPAFFVSAAAVWAAVGLPGCGKRPHWQAFQSPDGTFSLSLPGTPEASKSMVPSAAGPIAMASYIVTLSDDSVAMVSTADRPAGAPSPSADAVLEDAKNGAVTNSKSTLLDEKAITVDGRPGKEVEMKPSGSNPRDLHTVLHIVWSPPRLYTFGVATSPSSALYAERAQLFDSFHLASH